MKKRLSIIVALVLTAALSCTGIVNAVVDHTKTVLTFVGSSQTEFSTQVNKTFTIYVGDSLGPVASPIKASFVTVSGLYTTTGGSPTISFSINGGAQTAYTLKAVGATPTPFEVMYDTTSSISPVDAGTFSFTLNTIPSNVSITGFGAVHTLTYKYKPTTCDEGTNDKIKTVATLAGSSPAAFSGNLNKTFTLYVGDNLGAVTSPVKSSFVRLSGMYTATGASPSIALGVNGGAQTSFALPNVGATPTPFDIIYDSSSSINPTGAGTPIYTLNIVPSFAVINGMGAVHMLTYKYKPPVCGYPATGDLISAVLDTAISADGPAYNSIGWKGILPLGTKVRFQIATSSNPIGPFTFIGGSTCTNSDWYDTTAVEVPVEITCAPANHDGQRYFKYRIRLCSASDCVANSFSTPTVEDVIVSWAP